MGNTLKYCHERSQQARAIATPLRNAVNQSVMDDLMGFDQIAWRCLSNLPLPALTKLRAVSSGWQYNLEHYMRAGYVYLDVQLELRAMGKHIGVLGLWRGMEEGQVLNPEFEPALNRLVQFLLNNITRLSVVRMMHGTEPWMFDRIQNSTSPLKLLDAYVDEGSWRNVSQESMLRFVETKWVSLQSLTLVVETEILPPWFHELIRSVKTTCKNLQRGNFRLGKDREATDLVHQEAMADLLQAWLQMPNLRAIGVESQFPNMDDVPINVTAPVESLALGCPGLEVNANWNNYLARLLPCLPNLRILMLSCIDCRRDLASIICLRCVTLETLFLDFCGNEQHFVALLAEKGLNGEPKWLPKLRQLQMQEVEEVKRNQMPGYASIKRRPGLKVLPCKMQVEFLEDFDRNYKRIWKEWRASR